MVFSQEKSCLFVPMIVMTNSVVIILKGRSACLTSRDGFHNLQRRPNWFSTVHDRMRGVPQVLRTNTGRKGSVTPERYKAAQPGGKRQVFLYFNSSGCFGQFPFRSTQLYERIFILGTKRQTIFQVAFKLFFWRLKSLWRLPNTLLKFFSRRAMQFSSCSQAISD